MWKVHHSPAPAARNVELKVLSGKTMITRDYLFPPYCLFLAYFRLGFANSHETPQDGISSLVISSLSEPPVVEYGVQNPRFGRRHWQHVDTAVTAPKPRSSVGTSRQQCQTSATVWQMAIVLCMPNRYLQECQLELCHSMALRAHTKYRR